MVSMPLGSSHIGGQDQYGFKEMRLNGINDDARLESLNSFAEGVRKAIANVDAACRDGDERLVRVLEDLEDKMLAEKAEEQELMVRVQQFYEATPRRSARLAKKRLNSKE